MVRTNTKGILQSDVLIRTALMHALNELRQQPWLLDFAFSWLISDELTRAEYGEKQVEEAKEWFLNNEVPVALAFRTDRPQLPAIAIELSDTNESGANSLGDVSSEGPTEDVDATEIVVPQRILGPFTPDAYDSTTGIVTLPAELTTQKVFAGNLLYDGNSNTGYEIQEVLSSGTFRIATGVRANFTRAWVAPASSLYVAHLESVEFNETYRIRVMVNSAPVHVLYLHSILLFILLRGKQDLLEARGFERAVIRGGGGIALMSSEQPTEQIWYRDVVVSGYVRQYWPKTIKPKIHGFAVESMKVIDGGETPVGIQQEVADSGWEMEEDQLSALRR